MARNASSKKKLEWDPTFEPLVEYMLSSKGVRIRPAIEIGKKAVEYCRGHDIVKWILKNEGLLREKFPDCFDNREHVLTAVDADKLASDMIRLGFIYKAEHKPLAKVPVEGQSADSQKPKWPKRLEMCRDQKFETDKFFVVRYELKSNWQYIFLGLIIAAVLAVCLFPAWPLGLKLATWYISVVLTTAMIGCIVVRLVLFLALWFFGFDFWLFPNLFDEDKGPIESWMPLYAYEKRNDDWVMIGARVFLAILLMGALYQLSQTHSVSDVGGFAARQFLDVLDWGHQKLAAPVETSVPAMKFQEGDGLSTDPYDGYRCMQGCGFDSYDILKEECLFDCSCMNEVIESHCFKKCSPAAKASLLESREEACLVERISSAPVDTGLPEDNGNENEAEQEL